MIGRTGTAAALVFAAIMTASCATAGDGRSFAGSVERSNREGPTILRVVNTSKTEFDLHVMHSGKTGLHPLGRVAALATVEFELQHVKELHRGFYVIAQPVGTTTGYLSSMFEATAGQTITAQIAASPTTNVIALKGM